MTQGGAQLLGTLAVLLATATALVAAGTTAGDPEPRRREGRSLAELSVSLTPEVARRVERLRELDFDRIPRAEVVSGDHLGRLTRRELRRSGGSSDLAADEATVRMVGLLAPGERLGPALTAGGDLAAAAYDTRTDRLYVVRDAVEASRAMVEFVLAHELTHALEDESFGLAEPHDGSDDGALAALALGEGTATALMIDYASGFINPLELLAATAAVDDDTGDVPRFVIEQLEWAYLGGQEFVTALRELAEGWTLVDYAIESRPPASTEQVLHPRKYIHDERPLEVAIDDAALRAGGWRRATGGDIGEYSTHQLLDLGVDEPTAERAASGWGGDRYELWRREVAPASCTGSCRDDLVLALRWRWDTIADAREFAVAARRYVTEVLPDAATALAREGDSTTLVLAPTGGLARRIADG